ncbi:sodium/iodide cotransporter-like isoform X2 [Dermacentor albipictus]|uniref:sodium/iodide cotransporter-like isoform X2 n=1 Tax=Dermacentor albipictus TaxID=60249 RepID=UPI0038FD2F5A
MATTTADAADYATFASLTALSLGTGLYLSLRRQARFMSKEEVFLGSRTIHAIPLALSMVASSVTAVGLVGFVAYYYVHGFHTLWVIAAFVPGSLVVTYLFLPVLYQLKVTSIFEYLRMRYGNSVGIVSSLTYFVLSQTTGAAGIFSAAAAISTVFEVSLHASSVVIGVAGTAYTALGGLRSVVWADSIQALIMAASPILITTKIVYDSAHSPVPLRPLADVNVTAYILRTDLDITTDETVWAASLAAFPFHLMRLGLDQMITQRFLAARSLRDARVVAFAGVGLLSFFYILHGLTALAMVYWFRDCDPVLSGSITRYDQIVPYYVKSSARAINGVRGLFLAGIASASISTVSSVVNSNAAVLFVDIVSPNFHVPQAKTALVMAGLAAASGTVMTIVGLLVPYIGSAARFFITLSAAASGPFAGIVILAFLFPWANTKGTATAALGMFLIQTWQTTGRFMARIEPLRMTYGTDRCPGNSTYHDVPQHEDRPYSDIFPLYRLSAYWCCLFSTILTVLLGLTFSILSGT